MQVAGVDVVGEAVAVAVTVTVTHVGDMTSSEGGSGVVFVAGTSVAEVIVVDEDVRLDVSAVVENASSSAVAGVVVASGY